MAKRPTGHFFEIFHRVFALVGGELTKEVWLKGVKEQNGKYVPGKYAAYALAMHRPGAEFVCYVHQAPRFKIHHGKGGVNTYPARVWWPPDLERGWEWAPPPMATEHVVIDVFNDYLRHALDRFERSLRPYCLFQLKTMIMSWFGPVQLGATLWAMIAKTNRLVPTFPAHESIVKSLEASLRIADNVRSNSGDLEVWQNKWAGRSFPAEIPRVY